jgi:hypothetical protein
MKIQPSKRTNIKGINAMSAWEVLDNRNKLVGVFSANKDKDRKECGKLQDICKVQNMANDLSDVRQRIKDLIHKDNEWQITDRALQACDLTRQALGELADIIYHIKNS